MSPNTQGHHIECYAFLYILRFKQFHEQPPQCTVTLLHSPLHVMEFLNATTFMEDGMAAMVQFCGHPEVQI